MPQILIADDQADVREALKLLFKGEGYRSEVAANPARVLELVKERDFSLLLMDLNYASGLRQAVCNILSFARPRLTFSKISVALAVHTKGFGAAL